AQHFAKSKSDRETKLLADALKSEKFWGVQREIASALKDAGGDIARDALIAGLKAENPRVRRACAEQLGSFRDDKLAIAALRPIVEKGDASYYVEAAAIESFGKLQRDDALPVLKPLMSRESRFEVIRSAVLSAIAEQRDPTTIDLLMEWTHKGKPRECRPQAVQALAKVATNVHLDDAAMTRVVDAIAACLPEDSRFL